MEHAIKHFKKETWSCLPWKFLPSFGITRLDDYLKCRNFTAWAGKKNMIRKCPHGLELLWVRIGVWESVNTEENSCGFKFACQKASTRRRTPCCGFELGCQKVSTRRRTVGSNWRVESVNKEENYGLELACQKVSTRKKQWARIGVSVSVNTEENCWGGLACQKVSTRIRTTVGSNLRIRKCPHGLELLWARTGLSESVNTENCWRGLACQKVSTRKKLWARIGVSESVNIEENCWRGMACQKVSTRKKLWERIGLSQKVEVIYWPQWDNIHRRGNPSIIKYIFLLSLI